MRACVFVHVCVILEIEYIEGLFSGCGLVVAFALRVDGCLLCPLNYLLKVN